MLWGADLPGRLLQHPIGQADSDWQTGLGSLSGHFAHPANTQRLTHTTERERKDGSASPGLPQERMTNELYSCPLDIL